VLRQLRNNSQKKEWDEYACSTTRKLEKGSSRSCEEVHEIKSIIKELELA
jgi:hypothetical protein